jgi:hypothetical protein
MIYRHAVPLRTHPTPLVRQQAVEHRFGEPMRHRRLRTGTRREPSVITTDAIRRAFEAVGAVFLRQDDVPLRSDVVPRGDHSRRRNSGSSRPTSRLYNALTARAAAEPSTRERYHLV